MQTIEDLIRVSSGGSATEGSTQDILKRKRASIKLREIERDVKSKASQQGVSYVDLFGFAISSEALSLIPENIAKRLQVVCFLYNGTQIRLATPKPTDSRIIEILEKLNKQFHAQGSVYLVSSHSIKYALKLYESLPHVRKFISGVEINEEDLQKYARYIIDFESLNNKVNEVSITDVVTLILAASIKIKSSDIHIEAEEFGIAVRFRIDGVLQNVATIEKEKWKKIISRLKLLAKVKINITTKPQDGRFSIFLKDEKIDVRVSFLPTSYGESVVMRLLFSSAAALEFKDLGIRASSEKLLIQEISKPNGLVLVTGPTGSGKTTSLYAMLNKLNTIETKIITLENPVEYQLKGINQSQVDETKGYTFAKGLRSILRQDPDIVMVGEIRDLETAEIAVQASLTGHLVLSTLHTNDSSGVIPRLIEMGIKPFFLTPSINAVVAQRLVRKLCPKCRVEHVLSIEEKEKVGKILAVISTRANVEVPTTLPIIYKTGKGCTRCNGLGYKGRIGIYEIFTMSDNIKELVAQNASAYKILHQTIENGMITMLQDGILKTLSGVTTLSEVYRVIGKFDYVDALYDIVVSKTIGRGVAIEGENLARAEELSENLMKIEEVLKEVNYQDIVYIVMGLAYFVDAGDVHIEPTDSGVKIRFRIDGILHDIATLSSEHYINMLSKIKTISGIKSNIKKATIDSRFSLNIKGKKIDCRLSIISGGYGETMVVRLLSQDAASLKIEDLGMRSYTAEIIRKATQKTKGIIITTGPTGSGKTTTLYSLLNSLNKSDVKIITIEDPIEYHLDGVMQTQIDTENGYTFDAAIRSLMRQNPNIIMVGEIRDKETTKAAIEAAMTGHLVLSTVHANSAIGAISRFVGLGATRQMLASSIECSIGQRLVRKICDHCREEVEISEGEMLEVQKVLDSVFDNPKIKIPEKIVFQKGKGCSHCNGLGYKGRIGIYEVLEMTPDIQKMIQKEGITEDEILQEVIKNGGVTMLQDGVLKSLDGIVSISDVLRVAK